MTPVASGAGNTSAVDVRERLVEAVKLDLVGPWADHELANERLPGHTRPSNWYLTGFLIPSGTPPERRADVDENEDLDQIPEVAGLSEESNEDRKAAKKGFFPSSMGLSFLVPSEAKSLKLSVTWGDYQPAEIEDREGKPLSVWQRLPRREAFPVDLTGKATPTVLDVPGSAGLQIHVVERPLSSDGLDGQIPVGARYLSSW
jgi:hypothetical protein